MSDTKSDGNGIHIFRKDLRLNDNISLYEISKKTKNIYLFFHLNTFQVEDKKTEYFRSYNAINFMVMSLDRLNSESGGKLNIYKGSESEWIISSLDLGGRRFSKKGCSPLTGRMMKVDNSILKKYNAFNYVRKWLVKYKNMSDKELIKIKPKIDLEERYRMFCNMFKSL